MDPLSEQQLAQCAADTPGWEDTAPEVRYLYCVLRQHFGYPDEHGIHVPQAYLVQDIEDGCREGVYVMEMGSEGRTDDNHLLLRVRVLGVNLTSRQRVQLHSVLTDHRVGYMEAVEMEVGVSADWPGVEVADCRCLLRAATRYPDGYVIPVAPIERVIIDLETNGVLEENAIVVP